MADVIWNWDDFSLEQLNKPFYRQIVAAFSRYLSPGTKILEIGVGTGNLLVNLCQDLSCVGTGLDIDDSSLRLAGRLAGNHNIPLTLVKASGFCLPFGDNTFDAVLSEGVIEHFTKIETMKLIKEHVRVCKKGGRILISVPNILNLPHTFGKLILGKNFPYRPEKSYSYKSLAKMMEGFGVIIIGVDGFSPLWGLSTLRIGKRLREFLEQKLKIKDFYVPSSRFRALVGFECLVVGKKI